MRDAMFPDDLVGVVTTTLDEHDKACADVVNLSHNLMHYLWNGTPTDLSFIDGKTTIVHFHNDVHKKTLGTLDELTAERYSHAEGRTLTNERYHVTPLGETMHLVTLHCSADTQEGASDTTPLKVLATMIWETSPTSDVTDSGESPATMCLRLCQTTSVDDKPATTVAESEAEATDEQEITPGSTRPVALQASDTMGTTHWVAPAQVMYVAAAHQYTNVYCVDRTVRMRAPMGTVLKQLNGCVVRVHRSYAVNPTYISRMKGTTLYLINGIKIPIPTKRVRETRMMLAQYSDKLGVR